MQLASETHLLERAEGVSPSKGMGLEREPWSEVDVEEEAGKGSTVGRGCKLSAFPRPGTEWPSEGETPYLYKHKRGKGLIFSSTSTSVSRLDQVVAAAAREGQPGRASKVIITPRPARKRREKQQGKIRSTTPAQSSPKTPMPNPWVTMPPIARSTDSSRCRFGSRLPTWRVASCCGVMVDSSLTEAV